MVANYLKLPNYYKSQKIVIKPRQFVLYTALNGLLVFIIFGVLIYCNWQHINNVGNDAVKLDLRFNNFDALHKIYKDSSKKNLTSFTVVVETETAKAVIPDPFRVVCYYVSSYNISKSGILSPDSVDPYLCTHIIVGFAVVQNASIQPKSPDDVQVYKSIVNLKKSNPSLKILVSVQDISSKGEFARVVSTDLLRTTFATNTLTFLNNTGFDGIDLDWEFPSWPDQNLVQTRNFTLLLSKLRQLISNRKWNNFKPFIISVAVAAPELIMRQSYEIEEMAGIVDFVNLMSYDYHMYSQYVPVTGPNAPLYRRNADIGYMETLNTNWSAAHWVTWGMPFSKINVGIPTYGHSFRLLNEDNNGWNAPALGFGKTGDGNGFFTFPDACQFIGDASTTHVFDDEYDVPYAYNGDEWISFDNIISVELKAQYVKNNKFGGAMIYCLNSDDFKGFCSPQKFPLTRTISNTLMGQ